MFVEEIFCFYPNGLVKNYPRERTYMYMCLTFAIQFIFFNFYFIFKLYNIVLVLPNIEMNLPRV